MKDELINFIEEQDTPEEYIEIKNNLIRLFQQELPTTAICKLIQDISSASNIEPLRNRFDTLRELTNPKTADIELINTLESQIILTIADSQLQDLFKSYYKKAHDLYQSNISFSIESREAIRASGNMPSMRRRMDEESRQNSCCCSIS